ncbi:MAG: hypothetical protein Kow00109_09990 [Acidobacteriota bacterium]
MRTAGKSLLAAGNDPHLNFPVYLVDGRPSFAPHHIRGKPPVVVITIPKSGTYLLAAYLKALGLIDTGVHLTDHGFTDYRNKTLPEMLSRYREYYHAYPLSLVTQLIHEGQFAVAHIICNARSVAAFAKFRIVFAKRELRSTLISHMRWLERSGRGEDWFWKKIKNPKLRTLEFLHCCGPWLLSWYKSIANWQFQPRVLTVSFESLLTASAGTAVSVAEQVGVGISTHQAVQQLHKVLKKPTMTWSGKISNASEYWSKEAEELFQDLGGLEFSTELGYPANIDVPTATESLTVSLREAHELIGVLAHEGELRTGENSELKLQNRELKGQVETLQKQLRDVQKELTTMSSQYASFTWPNLCRAAAQAIESCRERGYRSVAFFGAGKHTRKLLPLWKALGGPPVIALIVRTTPNTRNGGGLDLPILFVNGPMPQEIKAVVPSSHTWESDMRRIWRTHHPEIPWVPLWDSVSARRDCQNDWTQR